MKEITDNNLKYSIKPNYFDINNYQIKLKVSFNFKLYLLIRELVKIMNKKELIENNNKYYI